MKVPLYMVLIFLFSFAVQKHIFAQSSTVIEAGIIMGGDGDFLGEYSNGFRNGVLAGIKGEYGTYGFFLSPGIYFQNFTISKKYTQVKPFVDDKRINMLKAKALLGYKTDVFTRKIKFKFGGGINANYIINIQKNDAGIDFKTLSDTYWGYTVETGIDILSFSLSLSYDKSFKEIWHIEDNKGYFDFMILTLGFKF